MAVKFKDYYETLGVARTATADEIKQAFRKLARIHHPDVARNKVSGEEKFKEINEAYEVLGDLEKRRRYDEMGPGWEDGAGGPFGQPGARHRRAPGPADAEDFEFGGTGFSDFFESFFSDRRGGFGSRHRRPFRAAGDGEDGLRQAGHDVEADLLVTLEEVLHGSKRKVTLRRGGEDGGPGRTNTYQVRIPPGMREGQSIRLAGQGGPGYGGGPAGDLYLRVRLARHPDLTVHGDDLYCDLDLAPWEAVLGVTAKIPVLDGTASVRVPPGTVAGSHLRMRGFGLPREDKTRGDLYATVRIQTPPSVTDGERELWERLASASTFNPRAKR